MMLYNINKWRSYAVSRLIIGLIFIYVYCEYLIYYITQVQCIWPALAQAPTNNAKPVYAMVLADIHLAGNKRGHWTDKWRQEWQMHKAFQTALSLHRPEAVFILGDLFDEGKSCSRAEFEAYVQRFYINFKVPEGTSLYVVAGEDDIGQHFILRPTGRKLTYKIRNILSNFEYHNNMDPYRIVLNTFAFIAVTELLVYDRLNINKFCKIAIMKKSNIGTFVDDQLC